MIRARRKLEEAFGVEIAVTQLFLFPTVRTLARHLGGATAEPAAVLTRSLEQIQVAKGIRTASHATASVREALEVRSREDFDDLEGIAIVGMSGRFPGAPNTDQFWKNLCNGVESITELTDEQLLGAGEDPEVLASPFYVKAASILDGIELFDADFFGLPPREAMVMDPQHRIFLECAWEALENAGYDPELYDGKIGVFAGSGMHSYYEQVLAADPGALRTFAGLQRYIALEKDFLTTRVSYRLNLKGPSVAIQTACSTSLVAVHFACQSLLNGDSDMVLAGGVSFRIPQIAASA